MRSKKPTRVIPGMPLGAAAMAYTLWTRHLKFNPKDPHWFNRDRFILSAGHGSMLLYALLHLFGYDLTLDDLKSFRQLGSKTPGHPEAEHTPGVEATTGPLGQGFGNAVGLAIAEAHLGAVYNRADAKIVDHFTYVIAGDGDLMEGICQEALSLAGHLQLGKLIVLYDDNHVSLAGPTDVTFTEDAASASKPYGWHVQRIDVEHANDVATIDASDRHGEGRHRPSVDHRRPHAHRLRVTAARHVQGARRTARRRQRQENERSAGLAARAGLLRARRRAGLLPRRRRARAHKPQAAVEDRVTTNGRRANPARRRAIRTRTRRQAAAELPWPTFNAENGSVATRDAGGIGDERDRQSAAGTRRRFGRPRSVDEDLPQGLRRVRARTPTRDATSTSACASTRWRRPPTASRLHGGLLPFCATFFNFLDYCKPALRLAALNKLHAIYVFTHDSVFLGEDGPTHQPIEQLAMLRATPNVIADPAGRLARDARSVEVRDPAAHGVRR